MKKPPVGQILGMLVRPGEGAATQDVTELVLDSQKGTVGDHSTRVPRQITILGREGWEAATQQLGRVVPWQARRANVLLSGLDLRNSAGRRLRIGECLIEVRGETLPCKVMDQAAPGLRDALVPEWRAGVHGTILRGGTIRTGDPAQFE